LTPAGRVRRSGVREQLHPSLLPERNAQLKASLVFAAVFYVAFGATDIATLGPTTLAWVLVALRVMVALVALGGCLVISRRPELVRASIGAACSLLVMALGVFMVVCWYQPGEMAWNVMSQGLILMAVYVNFPNRLVYAVAIGVGSSVFFVAMVFAQDCLETDDLLTLIALLVLGNALGYIAARRFHLAQREQFRHAFASAATRWHSTGLSRRQQASALRRCPRCARLHQCRPKS
jgi:hypothetical protein